MCNFSFSLPSTHTGREGKGEKEEWICIQKCVCLLCRWCLHNQAIFPFRMVSNTHLYHHLMHMEKGQVWLGQIALKRREQSSSKERQAFHYLLFPFPSLSRWYLGINQCAYMIHTKLCIGTISTCIGNRTIRIHVGGWMAMHLELKL